MGREKLHVFCDALGVDYGGCVFVIARNERSGHCAALSAGTSKIANAINPALTIVCSHSRIAVQASVVENLEKLIVASQAQ